MSTGLPSNRTWDASLDSIEKPFFKKARKDPTFGTYKPAVTFLERKLEQQNRVSRPITSVPIPLL